MNRLTSFWLSVVKTTLEFTVHAFAPHSINRSPTSTANIFSVTWSPSRFKFLKNLFIAHPPIFHLLQALQVVQFLSRPLCVEASQVFALRKIQILMS